MSILIMIHVNNDGSITLLKFPSVNLNVCIVNEYSYFFHGAHKIYLTYSKVMKPTHMAK